MSPKCFVHGELSICTSPLATGACWSWSGTSVNICDCSANECIEVDSSLALGYTSMNCMWLTGVTLIHCLQLESRNVLRSFTISEHTWLDTSILADWTAGLELLGRGPPGVWPVMIWLVSDSLPGEVCFASFTFSCVKAVTLFILPPQQSTCNQNSRPSFPNTQKNREMKKPWRELKIAQRNWKAVEASRTVRILTPNTHVNPNRAITTIILIMSLMTVFRFACSLLANFLWICLASTLITMTNMSKDGSQEHTKEHISIANEAAGGKKVKYLYAFLKCSSKKTVMLMRSGFSLSNWVHVGSVADTSSTDSVVDNGWWKRDHQVTVN